LATFALCRGMSSPRVKRLLLGIAVGVAPYVIHVATAGPGHVFQGMVIDPLFNLRGGRGLPVPPGWSHLDGVLDPARPLQHISWPLPQLAVAHQLFLWFFFLLLTNAFLLFVAWRATRRAPAAAQTRILLVSALFSVGLLPQAMQRVDSAHFSWVGCV